MPKLSNSHPAFDSSGYNSTESVALFLNVSASWLHKARVYGGGPPFARFGSAIKYHGPAVLAWAAAQTRQSTSEKVEAA